MPSRKQALTWPDRSAAAGTADTFSVSTLQADLLKLDAASTWVRATPPPAPLEGDLWADTTLGLVRLYHAGRWVTQLRQLFNVRDYNAVGNTIQLQGLVGIQGATTVFSRLPLPLGVVVGSVVRLYGMGAPAVDPRTTLQTTVTSVAADRLSMGISPAVGRTVGSVTGFRYRGEGYVVGAANDTAPIAAAVNAAIAAGGGTVYFPAGCYTHDGNIPIGSGVEYAGDGTGATTLFLKANAGPVSCFRSVSHALSSDEGASAANNAGDGDFAFRRMTIDGNKFDNPNARYGLMIYGLGYVLEDVVVRHTRDYGVFTEWVPTGGQVPPLFGTGIKDMGAYWSRLDFVDCQGGFNYMGPHDPVFSNLRVFFSGTQADYSQDPLLSDHALANFNVSPISGLGSAAGALVSNLHVFGKALICLRVNSSQVTFSNLYVENASGGTGTLVDCRLANNVINGGRFFGSPGTVNVDAFVINTSTADNWIVSNVFVNNVRRAFYFFDNTVTGWIIRNCSGFTTWVEPDPPAATVQLPAAVTAAVPANIGGAGGPGKVLPADLEADFTNTGGYDRSVRKRGGGLAAAGASLRGAEVVAADIAPGAGWGAAATVSVKPGSTVFRGEATILAGTTGVAATPVATLTFAQPFASSPFVTATRLNGPAGMAVNSYSATQVTFVYNGTPAATQPHTWGWKIEE